MKRPRIDHADANGHGVALTRRNAVRYGEATTYFRPGFPGVESGLHKQHIVETRRADRPSWAPKFDFRSASKTLSEIATMLRPHIVRDQTVD
jgi:hypothetical protein